MQSTHTRTLNICTFQERVFHPSIQKTPLCTVWSGWQQMRYILTVKFYKILYISNHSQAVHEEQLTHFVSLRWVLSSIIWHTFCG